MKTIITLIVAIALIATAAVAYTAERNQQLPFMIDYPENYYRNQTDDWFLIWYQNKAQKLRFMFPIGENDDCNANNRVTIQWGQYCQLSYDKMLMAGTNIYSLHHGMVIRDEAGTLWGPYYIDVDYIPEINR